MKGWERIVFEQWEVVEVAVPGQENDSQDTLINAVNRAIPQALFNNQRDIRLACSKHCELDRHQMNQVHVRMEYFPKEFNSLLLETNSSEKRIVRVYYRIASLATILCPFAHREGYDCRFE